MDKKNLKGHQWEKIPTVFGKREADGLSCKWYYMESNIEERCWSKVQNWANHEPGGKKKFLFQVFQNHPHFQGFSRNHRTQHIIVLIVKMYHCNTRRTRKGEDRWAWRNQCAVFLYSLLPLSHRTQIPPAGKMQQHMHDVSAQRVLFETNSLGVVFCCCCLFRLLFVFWGAVMWAPFA